MWHNVEASAAKEKTMVHNVEVEPVREVEEVIIKVPYSEGVCGDAESLVIVVVMEVRRGGTQAGKVRQSKTEAKGGVATNVYLWKT